VIEVWRLVKKIYASGAFSGDGARRYGGRWSHRGWRVVYTADTLSLAALELFVHLGRVHQGREFAVFRVRIPERPPVKKIENRNLPPEWRKHPALETCKDLGSAWLEKDAGLVLQTPSVVIPHQHKFLINPDHPTFKKIKIERLDVFSFDPRMWK
jgi:RES domain-containing protein